ncbi:hypothetical protein [Neobacillus cucumis]|uniref:hypothetical protein n=1 Tax=Neobacillus cucumis TaxID=1740721 RepID=UPI001964728C|nr:hypothetical protein [Neobacillus cucumis]MBM7654728.1 hypothetical protein [Neobacillus cucumis]
MSAKKKEEGGNNSESDGNPVQTGGIKGEGKLVIFKRVTEKTELAEKMGMSAEKREREAELKVNQTEKA